MNWTITYNGVERVLADWGLSEPQRSLVSQGMDELVITARKQPADASPLFAYQSTILLQRDRLKASDGTFSSGTPWFSGLIVDVSRAGSGNEESISYRASGPWWYLVNRVFAQPFQNVFLGYAIPGVPASGAQYGVQNATHIFLNQSSDIGMLGKINNGQQIVEALNWALKPFVDDGTPPPFQVGSVAPDLDIPIDEVHEITCAEVIQKMLRWSPDAVAWFDYTTSPPTFNCMPRAQLSSKTLSVTNGLISSINVKARYDIQVPSVQLFYEITSSVNGQSVLTYAADLYPSPLPTDALSQFRQFTATINLQGSTSSSVTGTIKTASIVPTDLGWWLGKHPEYAPYSAANPAETNVSILAVTLDQTSILIQPNPTTDIHGSPVTLLGYTNELIDGQIAPWMNFQTQRITISVIATVNYRNGSTKKVPLTYSCLVTTGTTGTYSNNSVSGLAEPVPQGLAQYFFTALNVLQYDGTITLQEAEISGQVLVGQLLNVTGSDNNEWNTMAAMVQSVDEDFEKGVTRLHVGPPKHLSAGELVDLLRATRNRLITSSFGMRANGSPGSTSGDVTLGSNTSEKNSVSGVSPSNPHVISQTVDGSGAVIQHTSSGTDCSSQWISNPVKTGSPTPGSITIKLTDAAGQNLSIQKIAMCLSGVEGSMYLLCSGFVPDDDGD